MMFFDAIRNATKHFLLVTVIILSVSTNVCCENSSNISSPYTSPSSYVPNFMNHPGQSYISSYPPRHHDEGQTRSKPGTSLRLFLNTTRKAEDYSDDQNYSGLDADELCREYLYSFLAGTTDAKDNCEGIQNAYIGAACGYSDIGKQQSTDDDNDDYFGKFNQFSCCQALKSHHDQYCEDNDIISNMHLLLIASILLICEIAKSFITKHELHFLPEAGGCIMVGTLAGLCAHLVPNFDIDDLSFDEDLFLCILLPPIIFEAALSVNKLEFRRRRLAILMFAVIGTIFATFVTGFLVHYSSKWISEDYCPTIPMLDSIVFGALISSIDPVAILSVLTSLNMTETDTVFIMVFGESLLNDGIAITLFKALVNTYGNVDEGINTDAVLGLIADFLIVFIGSIVVGVVCGFASLLYFWCLRKKLHAPMEVVSFFLWAGIPYYICDEIGWSGIVAIVTMGFFMDVYVAAPKSYDNALHQKSSGGLLTKANINHSNYIDLGDSLPCTPDNLCGANAVAPSARSIYSIRSLRTLNVRELLFREERFRLTAEADRHVRFVAHLLSQLAENCIFVYLGLFLFSAKYSWNLSLLSISIVSCILSRAVMVWLICSIVWYINICRNRQGKKYHPESFEADLKTDNSPHVSRTAMALQDRKIQLVLVLAGLRGAVSLALVENVPIYNGITGEGSEFKPQLKGMTSAAIIFTVFVFGGGAYYILKKLDLAADDEKEQEQELPSIYNRNVVGENHIISEVL